MTERRWTGADIILSMDSLLTDIMSIQVLHSIKHETVPPFEILDDIKELVYLI